jgi:hypothetical protein
MVYTTAELITVENRNEITKEELWLFRHDFQLGVLLTLKDEGLLNEVQFRFAREELDRQRRNHD